MIEDKYPVCPIYRTGEFCDCARNKVKISYSYSLPKVFLLGIVTGALIMSLIL